MNETRHMSTNSVNSESINIRTEVEKYLIHWKWILFSVVVLLSASVLFIKSTPNIYVTKASLLIKEDGGASTDLKAFQDLSALGVGATSNIFDEIEILRSRYLALACAKKNELNIEVYQKQALQVKELYDKAPMHIQVLSDKEAFYQLDTIVNFTWLDEFSYQYQVEDVDKVYNAKFGEKIMLGKHELLITPKSTPTDMPKGQEYQIKFRNIVSVAEQYKNQVSLNYADKYSNIILLELEHPVKAKAQDVLNTLIDLYNQISIDDQNIVGNKTDQFITKRLEVVKSELDEVDRLEEMFKKDKEIADISMQSKLFVDTKSNNEQEIFKKKTELRLIEFMVEDIETNDLDFQLLPASIGISEAPQLSVAVQNYNQMLVERNRILRASSASNPVVLNLDQELKNAILNIKQSLVNTKKQLKIALNSLEGVEENYKSRISNLPKQEREYRGILRKQEIIAELYSYLLQKKEENEISMAVTVSNSKVIDRAYTVNLPVAPKKKVILFAGLLIGLAIPIGVIYGKDLLDTKLKTKKELEQVINAPYVGDIPLDKTGEKIVIQKGSRTSVAEAFRLLRTNLDFMMTQVQKPCKSIFVTSTISGEGKTFVAVNTAAAIALTNKKVVIVGMDLRAPKVTQYLGLPNRNGVTNYLVDKTIEIEELIHPLEGFQNLYILSSGVVPPNPAELLLSERTGEMFQKLQEQFDYIVVDTAPVNLVTDTLMISHFADMVLYTARAGYLDKRFLEVPQRMYEEKRLPNMAMLLNALDYTRGYGYGYGGYGYPKENDHQNWFKKIFRK
ncbi:GumC family protein [Ochrovirga pacifica]|uniref:GumC family protein n=1 Tax=Ochrovirga pacifica TaxID=1042376 RepID=UPI000255A06A|nr:tyrosine-protein kinase [Ochrovirga pacifica]